MHVCVSMYGTFHRKPAGQQSVSQAVGQWSVVQCSFGQSYSQSVSGVTRHNYAVLKFNVERKRWHTRRGSTSFDHHCPCWRNEFGWSSKGTKYCQLIRQANLEKRLPVTLDQSPFGQSVGRSVSQSVSRSVSRSTPVNWPVFYEKYCMYMYVCTCVCACMHEYNIII